MKLTMIGNAVLICADSYEFIKSEFYNDLGKIDCLVTDPPYNFRSKGGGLFGRARNVLDDINDNELADGFDFKIMDPCRYNSMVVFCHNDQLPDLLWDVKEKWDRFTLCQYHKTNPIPVRNHNYIPDTEFYVHAWREGLGYPVGEYDDMHRYHVCARVPNGETNHPTPKPLSLMRKVIRNVNGNVIFDPFMGSGSTGIAAIEAGKKFIGIEKNRAFYDEAVERIKK